MKLREYCECGGEMVGTIKPDYKGFEMQRIFWKIHSGKGHSSVEPSQCYLARRREEMKNGNSLSRA